MELLYFSAFIGIIALFGFYAFRPPWKPGSVSSFFHSPKPRQNLISLVVSNITVGSGLVYLTALGYKGGLLMLLVPAAFLLGYYLLELFVNNVLPTTLKQHGNFFAAAQHEIEQATGRRSLLPWFVMLPLVLVYLSLFSYEIFIGSRLISSLISSTPEYSSYALNSLTGHISIALIIFFSSLAFCFFSGIRAVFRTDLLQLFAILLFLGTLLYGVFTGELFHESPIQATSVPLAAESSRTEQWLFVLVAIFLSVATQFYSLLNWFIVSNINHPEHTRRVLRGTGLSVVSIFALLVIIGASIPLNSWDGQNIGALMQQFVTAFNSETYGPALIIALILGLTSIVLSTVDTLMISLTMYVHDGLFHRNSRSAATSGSGLQFARFLLLSGFMLAFTVLAGMLFSQPGAVVLLFAIAGGGAVFAPLVVTIGLTARDPARLAILNNWVLFAYFSFSVAAMLLSFVTMHAGKAEAPYIGVAYITLYCLLASSILSALIAGRSYRPESTQRDIADGPY